MIRNSGGATGNVVVVLIVLALGGTGVLMYSNGTLSQWLPRSGSPAMSPPSGTGTPSTPTVQTPGPDEDRPRSIFDVPGSTGGPQSNAPSANRNPSPNVTLPDSAPPPVLATPGLDLIQARLKLSAATAAVEKSLQSDPEYQQLKADVDSAEGRKKTVLAESGPGSPDVVAAGQQWLDAKASLRKKLERVANADPAVQAAQRELNEAQRASRSGKP